jgi:hypothetical protein
MAIFNSYVTNYQRVVISHYMKFPTIGCAMFLPL